jgi:hypothetical protein
MSKSAKRRMCPAISRKISASECRDHRGSHYHCPAECRFNPFAPANYLNLLKTEQKLASRSFPWLVESAKDPNALKAELSGIIKSQDPQAINRFMQWNLFFKQDESGLTSAQRWEQAGFPGLKNDEKVLLRHQMRTRVVLLEIREIQSLEQFQAVDLLSPGSAPLVFKDRIVAGSAPRFGPYLAWAYPLPSFWRLSGMAVQLPDMAPCSPLQVVEALATHLGAPAQPEPLRIWLAEHFDACLNALHATALARRKRMFDNSNTQVGRAIYEVQSPLAECRRLLESLDEVHPTELHPTDEQEGFVAACLWFDQNPSPAEASALPGRAVLGRVVLGQSHWRLEAIGSDRLARLKQELESRMGSRLKFQGERLDDLGRQMIQKDPGFDEKLVPASLLEHVGQLKVGSTLSAALPSEMDAAEAIETMAKAQQQAAMHQALPFLDNKTPVEAAKIPALRPRVVELMKARIRNQDEENLRQGTTTDLTWALDELGLAELKLPPPPERPMFDPTQLSGLDSINRPRTVRPAAPLLPEEPLSAEETMARLDALMDRYQDFGDAKAEIFESGTTIITDTEALLDGLLNEKELSFLRPFLVQAWFVLVPPGCQPPPMAFESLLESFDSIVIGIHDNLANKSLDGLSQFLATMSQPHVTHVIVTALFSAMTEAPRNERPRPKTTTAMIAALVTLIEETDRCLRAGGEPEPEELL